MLRDRVSHTDKITVLRSTFRLLPFACFSAAQPDAPTVFVIGLVAPLLQPGVLSRCVRHQHDLQGELRSICRLQDPVSAVADSSKHPEKVAWVSVWLIVTLQSFL